MLGGWLVSWLAGWLVGWLAGRLDEWESYSREELMKVLDVDGEFLRHWPRNSLDLHVWLKASELVRDVVSVHARHHLNLVWRWATESNEG